MEKDLWISATQLESFRLCNRKWWFSYVSKLPTIQMDHFAFGDVMHKVAERYFLADDNGYDADGNPVDLFPEGWAEGLDPRDQVLIKDLVEEAISQGVWSRRTGREVERKIEHEVIPGAKLVGYIDVFYPDKIEDHKTTKNMRYAKSKKTLPQALPMLVYAYDAVVEAKKAGRPLDTVKLRHNIFLKDYDNPRVKSVEVPVTVEDVESFWTSTVQPTAEKMLKTRKIEEWTSVTPAEPESGACAAFGGCPFLDICRGVETPDMHARRIERVNNRKKESSDMGSGFADKLAARRAAKAGNGSATKEQPAKAKTFDEWGETPWAVPSCGACSGRGVNSKGSPCRICLSKGKVLGRPPIEWFSVDESGWAVLDEHQEALKAMGWPGEMSGNFRDEEEAKASKPKVKEEVETEPVKVEVDEPEVVDNEETTPAPRKRGRPKKTEAATPEKPKRGRPKKAFTLCINCLPSFDTTRKTVDLSKIMERYGKMLAEERQVDSYWLLDAFARRDYICTVIEDIAEELGSDIVVARASTPDAKAIIEALRPRASEVFEGTIL